MKVSKIVIASITASSLLGCKEDYKTNKNESISSKDTIEEKQIVSSDSLKNIDTIVPIKVNNSPCPSCGMG